MNGLEYAEQLLTPDISTAIDGSVTERFGIPPSFLMENAGAGTARIIAERCPAGDVLFLVGSGNNGADGLVAARHLIERGRRVRILHVPGRSESELFTVQRRIAEACGIAIEKEEVRFETDSLRAGDAHENEFVWLERFAGIGVVVDGLVGTGGCGHLRAEASALLGAVRRAKEIYPSLRCVAIDLPSGVDGETGAVSEGAMPADITVTFGAAKQGLYLYPARRYGGDIVVVPLGIPRQTLTEHQPKSYRMTEAYARYLLPFPRIETAHKGTNGHAVVIGGSSGMTGAAALTAEGALRIGAGKVTVSSDAATDIAKVVSLEVMTKIGENPVRNVPDGVSVIAVGPGLGRSERTEALLSELSGTHAGIPVVADADALYVSADMPEILRKLTETRAVIMTPHVGEFSKLTGMTAADIESNRIGAARDFAVKYGVTLVLKGAPTVTANASGTVLVNSTGNSGMATGGMGDVLTGVIAGLVAQGLDSFEAAVLGVYLHGEAADVLAEKRPFGFTAGETAKEISYVVGRLTEGRRHE